MQENPLFKSRPDNIFPDVNPTIIQNLIESAEEAQDELDQESSKSSQEKAFQIDPQNENLLISQSSFLCVVNETEKAKALLLQAINLYPGSANQIKYMQLAQLEKGKNSVSLQEKGLNVLENLKNSEKIDQKNKEMCQDLAQTQCAIAEIQQTDLLAEPDSKQKCDYYIEKALIVSPNSLDPLLQKVNFHLNSGDQEKASTTMQILQERLMKIEKNEQKVEEKNDEKNDEYPIDFKIQVAKLLLELQSQENAEKLLMALREYEEENNEIVQLLSLSFFKKQDYDESSNWMSIFKEMPKMEDEELYSAAKELEKFLLECPKVQKNSEKGMENEDKMEEEEWMDIEK